MKSEPEVFGIEDLRRKKTAPWDGVRNYAARNFLRAMEPGDLAFFYHSNAKPSGVAGVMEIVRAATPDPGQFDPKSDYSDPKSKRESPTWSQVDVRFQEAFPRLISLDEMKSIPALSGMLLFKRGRLSVMPVTEGEWAAVLKAVRP